MFEGRKRETASDGAADERGSLAVRIALGPAKVCEREALQGSRQGYATVLVVARVANVTLRGATLASRFLFVFFFARFFEPASLGLYGLFSATVSYALYLVGFDFYTYTTREILRKERTEWGSLLKNQLTLSGVLYVVFIPLLCLLFIFNILPTELMMWFMVILILEHLNQEVGRLLIVISEQLLASLLLFVRQAAWAILLVALMTFDSETRTLGHIFMAWALAGMCAAAIGCFRLWQLQMGGWQAAVDWKWIKMGLKVCIPLLVATLAVRGLFTLDRYWLQALGGMEVVGAYVLFMGMAGTLMAFLDAGIFCYSYPALIKAFQGDRPEEFRARLRQITWQTLILSAAFSAVSLAVLPFLLKWIGRDFYILHQETFVWLLLAMVINGLSMIPHYALYAQGRDRPIVVSHLASILVFVATTLPLSAFWPLTAVPMGLAITFTFILLWKSRALFATTPKQFIFSRA